MKTGDLVGGKYRLIRALGHGTMGSVWEALNERAARRVALKLILRPSEEMTQRLLSEARACGSLSHRNIVEVYDVGETATGEPFLVMQLLDGETLAACLDYHRRLSAEIAAHIARDVAFALAAAHEKSIIHRDLKPANIYLHRMGGPEAGAIVKVVDFGVSRLLTAETRVTLPGMIVGSPVYMSPEQFLMLDDLDHRTDIWSLGVCLFEMLTGVRPFLGKSVEEISAQVLRTIAPPVTSRIRNLDGGLVTIVARCLKRDRAMRIGSATELAAMLEPYAKARSDAPIFIPSPAPLAVHGTVIMSSELPPHKPTAPETRDSSGEGGIRPAPWREKPLDEILTATVAALSAEGAGTAPVEAPLVVPALNRVESTAPPIESPNGLSENRRSNRHSLIFAVGFVVCFVGLTSIVVANRQLARTESAGSSSITRQNVGPAPVQSMATVAATPSVSPPKPVVAEPQAPEPEKPKAPETPQREGTQAPSGGVPVKPSDRNKQKLPLVSAPTAKPRQKFTPSSGF